MEQHFCSKSENSIGGMLKIFFSSLDGKHSVVSHELTMQYKNNDE